MTVACHYLDPVFNLLLFGLALSTVATMTIAVWAIFRRPAPKLELSDEPFCTTCHRPTHRHADGCSMLIEPKWPPASDYRGRDRQLQTYEELTRP